MERGSEEERREEGKGETVTLGEPVIERMTGKGIERNVFHSCCWHEVTQAQTAGHR